MNGRLFVVRHSEFAYKNGGQFMYIYIYICIGAHKLQDFCLL